jgi:hypothetical protein
VRCDWGRWCRHLETLGCLVPLGRFYSSTCKGLRRRSEPAFSPEVIAPVIVCRHRLLRRWLRRGKIVEGRWIRLVLRRRTLTRFTFLKGLSMKPATWRLSARAPTSSPGLVENRIEDKSERSERRVRYRWTARSPAYVIDVVGQ